MPTEVKGAGKLRKALKQFEPDLAKETTKELGTVLKPIAAKARGYMPSESPLSGWATKPNSKGKFPTYDGSVAKRNISYKTSPSRPNSRGWRSLVSILNKSAAGVIYEWAGRTNPGGNFSPRLDRGVSQMKGQGKFEGRGIFRAWEEDQGRTQGAVIKAIESSAEKFNKRTPKVK
jgi:hypothetical protein